MQIESDVFVLIARESNGNFIGIALSIIHFQSYGRVGRDRQIPVGRPLIDQLAVNKELRIFRWNQVNVKESDLGFLQIGREVRSYFLRGQIIPVELQKSEPFEPQRKRAVARHSHAAGGDQTGVPTIDENGSS